ncbi:MAG: hypothetical protein J5U17_09735, partial [Candidatus Methanoperedens sp.]|nr:hypothetical protein [Candidatus Methanoperedens sp.]
AKDNPVLALFRYHIMPRYPEIVIRRPEKYGGDLHYKSFEALETDFIKKAVHPMDLKSSGADYMNKILEPVRRLMAVKKSSIAVDYETKYE